MASLPSLVALLGDGQSSVDDELLLAECAELTRDPALDSVLTPLFERRFGMHPHSLAPNLIMQGALDAPGTPLFDAALAHWPSWKAPVLVHAPLELPLLRVLSDASPALEVGMSWRTFTSARETSLPLRRTEFLGHHVFIGDHLRKTDSVCVTTKSHMTYCPLGKGGFDQLVVAGDLIFVASSKKPAAVQALRFFEPLLTRQSGNW